MNLILRGGQAVGVVGLGLMATAVLTRLGGRYIIGGFESGSLLIAGIGAIGVGSFALLWVIAERGRR